MEGKKLHFLSIIISFEDVQECPGDPCSVEFFESSLEVKEILPLKLKTLFQNETIS